MPVEKRLEKRIAYPSCMPPRTLVIANPRSRRGRNLAIARPESFEAKLRRALGPLDIEWTRAPRDAERIAREGVRAGIERVIAAGGDGTLSEVVSGLLSAQLGDYAAVGFLPLGTASDFARGLGQPSDLDAAIARIATGKTAKADAGRVTYFSDEGREITRYFANIASFGLSGIVGELANRSRKPFGARISYLVATLRGVARHRSTPISIRVDAESVFEGPLCVAAVANGPCFGAGMRIAPDAKIDDGVFDWVIVPGMPRLALLRKLPLLYSGSHLRDPRILQGRGRVIEARPVEGAARLEVDGESLGVIPARFEILPGALTLAGLVE